CELSRLVDPAGVHAQPEGRVDQVRIGRILAECKVDLVGGGIVVVILLGDSRGEVATAQGDERELQAARRLGLPLRRRLGLAALLGDAGCRKGEKQRRGQQREMGTSHGFTYWGNWARRHLRVRSSRYSVPDL